MDPAQKQAYIERNGNTLTLTLTADSTTLKAIIDNDQKTVEKYVAEAGFTQPLRDPAVFFIGPDDVGRLVGGSTFTSASGVLWRVGWVPEPVRQGDVVLTGIIVASRVLAELNFPNLCDLWQPTVVKSGKEIAGITFTLYQHNQACLFISTPEVDVPAAEGRTKEVNIFTLDQFEFPSGVPVRDGWVIKLLTAGDNQNLFWAVQGNPQSNMPPPPYWPVTSQMVYAKRLPKPPTGVS